MFRVMIPEKENPQEAKRVYTSLHCVLRLIRVNTLLRVHDVGLLAGRLIYDCLDNKDKWQNAKFCDIVENIIWQTKTILI